MHKMVAQPNGKKPVKVPLTEEEIKQRLEEEAAHKKDGGIFGLFKGD